MYSHLYRLARLRLAPGGGQLRRHLRALEKSQWLSPEEDAARRLDKLRALVGYAYEHVPFYRQRYQAAGIHPDDVRSFRDFEALPFLTKQDVREHLEQLRSTAYRGTLRRASTSGSTGEPLRFYVERDLRLLRTALQFRFHTWHGVRIGDKVAAVWRTHGLDRWRQRLKMEIARHRALDIVAMTPDDMQRFAEMLLKWQPALIRAHTSSLFVFCRFLEERGITGIRPRVVETGVASLYDTQRATFERVFGCPVADAYGASEFYEIAFECPQGRLHVLEPHYVEVVASGQAAPPGQLGEIVVTSLEKYGLPLIRYRLNDVGIAGEGLCPCGRGLPFLAEVTGRVSDCMLTPDGVVVGPPFFIQFLEPKPEVAQFQIRQPDPQHIEVRLALKGPVEQAWLDEVRGKIADLFGETVHVSISIVDDIPPTAAGKRRYIVSDVEPHFVL